MKTKLLLFILLVTSCLLPVRADAVQVPFPEGLVKGYTEGYSGNAITFRNGECIIQSEYYESVLFRCSYYFENEDGLDFLVLPDAGKRYLCLGNDIVCMLYEEDGAAPWFMGYWSLMGSELIGLFKPDAFSASSELTEGAVTYKAGNLADFSLKTPWVEGAAGNGTGESVSFSISHKYLYLFSGYISYDKPYLYEQNARPRKIKITITDKGKSQEFVFDLEDTPNPQTLEFPDRMEGTAKLEILEVYPGTKYQDTCIHALMGKYF